ncbi:MULTISPECIES: EAL domain-containing protein [Ralstonia]|jgi:lactose/cellobiose-specific phosphotransferase system IIC component|uniref:Diguanylate phosphodiesterase n=2 Tax=Pseudomonadota TaxID=1224 RepID=R0EDV0_RALPI|nr:MULTISPECIES: EAL domain-containing protein [Ralstonia]MEA3268059.1 EAL domain-containing protein [Pseudomonadota bacterium]PCI27915.1 MAG: PTS lactose transporter subunit IIC [Candidatus Wolfebacteria bacterium]ENZ79527.1 diguanylate phosphodiesterase [Ralstonia pickettii OR214]MCM3580205.1 EAL domain-containing protein [Ralstonia pickettii]MDR9385246.1 EAL domain-containing protein [Ralstonia sp. 11b]
MTTQALSPWLRLLSAAERFDRGPYFIAIRRGLALSLPLIMVGAVALLLRNPPTAGMRYLLLEAFGTRLDAFCDSVLAGTIGIGSLVALFGFADVLAQLHNQRAGHRVVNPTVAAVVVVSCFFTLIAPAANASLMAWLSLGQGLFGALMVASLGGSLFLKLCSIRRLRIPSHHLSNDLLVGDVLSVVPAGMLTILTFALLKAGMAWAGWLHFMAIVDPLLAWPYSAVSNSLLFGLGYETAAQVLWLFGIHGPNALYTVHQHILEPAAQANAAAVASGGQPPFIFTYHFFAVFARMGGSGGTLSLILALLISRRMQRGRKMALVVMLPALFNVNEPLLFGLPLVLNPVYAIPFLLTPVVQILIAYAATVADLMPKTSYPVAWTTPALFSGYAATGSVWGAVVQLIGLVVGAAIYLPFVRMADVLSARRSQDVLASLLQIAESAEVSLKGRRCLDLPGDEGRMAVALASDLESAIKKDGQIFLEFQPQVDCSTGRVFGAEALLRWQHPVLGRVAPPIVVALADDIGQIDQLGLRILSLACQQRAAWRDVLPDDFVVAVNLSPRQLLDCRLYRNVLDILHREGLSPTQLELEITESTMLLPDITAIGNLKQLREAGVKVALDDFGMGHTSLHYLRELPLDTVKIDRSLADVSAGSVNEHIVRSIASLSRTLNLSTVVEGVETEQQLERLSALGCERFQGYFFSRPLAPSVCQQFVLDANLRPLVHAL